MAPFELLRKGGRWLGTARNWLQWNTRNGDVVRWGSGTAIQPPMTARQVEELAAFVANTVYEDCGTHQEELGRLRDLRTACEILAGIWGESDDRAAGYIVAALRDALARSRGQA